MTYLLWLTSQIELMPDEWFESPSGYSRYTNCLTGRIHVEVMLSVTEKQFARIEDWDYVSA